MKEASFELSLHKHTSLLHSFTMQMVLISNHVE